MRKVIWMIIVCGITFSATCQDFKKFNLLLEKTDSCYRVKNHALGKKYYEQLIELPEREKPQNIGYVYYNIACVYSLNREKEKALYYLEKSFVVDDVNNKNNHSKLDNIVSDADLDFIRGDHLFMDILKKYYRDAPLSLMQAKEISYDQLLEIIAYLSKRVEFSRPITIKDKLVFWKKEGNKYIFNESKLNLPNLEGLKGNNLDFQNINFQLNFIWSTYNGLQQFPYYRLSFTNCNFNGTFFLSDMEFIFPPRFKNSTFTKDLFLSLVLTYEGGKDEGVLFNMDGCSLNFSYINLTPKSPIRIWIKNCHSLDSADFIITCNNASEALIINDSFENKNVELELNESDLLKVTNNKFNKLKISETKTLEFDLQKNEISKLLLRRSYFSNEPANDVDWKNLDIGLYESVNDTIEVYPDQGRIVAERNRKMTAITGEKLSDISIDQNFNQLMGLYSMFLNLYKNKNSLEYYNSCFIEIKELQSKRLKYLYESNKTFETYFRWKLSELLKFYVRHGTDPARAIVISIYIIFAFGVFFFFFPSDWDVTSKSRLISNFKDFIHKNEKGYIKPFFILLAGFSLSLLNALTLSLNAFITLGFGNIPTHGLARYVCVLEGFMGWFLLSIFTVALINQVI